MANLPQDVVEEILTKLPPKSLLRFKSLSKPFYFLISNPLFVKSHLRHSQNNPRWLFDYYRLRQTKTLESAFNWFNLKHPNIFKYDYYKILSTCDGMIALQFFSSRRCRIQEFFVIICNLCTRESRQLPIHCPVSLVNPISGASFGLGFGFGYDLASDNYKVVQVFIRWSKILTMVLSLNSNTWRKFENNNEKKVRICEDAGIYLNGALHWGGRGSLRGKYSFMIVALNLADEKYLELTPFGIEFDDDIRGTRFGNKLPWITVYKDCICVCKYYMSSFSVIDGCVSLWMMEEYGNPSSWTSHRINISSHVARRLPSEFRIFFSRDTTKSGFLEDMIIRTYDGLIICPFSKFLYQKTLVSPCSDVQHLDF